MFWSCFFSLLLHFLLCFWGFEVGGYRGRNVHVDWCLDAHMVAHIQTKRAAVVGGVVDVPVCVLFLVFIIFLCFVFCVVCFVCALFGVFVCFCLCFVYAIF